MTVLPPGEWDPSIRIEPPKNVPSQVRTYTALPWVPFFFLIKIFSNSVYSSVCHQNSVKKSTQRRVVLCLRPVPCHFFFLPLYPLLWSAFVISYLSSLQFSLSAGKCLVSFSFLPDVNILFVLVCTLHFSHGSISWGSDHQKAWKYSFFFFSQLCFIHLWMQS